MINLKEKIQEIHDEILSIVETDDTVLSVMVDMCELCTEIQDKLVLVLDIPDVTEWYPKPRGRNGRRGVAYAIKTSKHKKEIQRQLARLRKLEG